MFSSSAHASRSTSPLSRRRPSHSAPPSRPRTTVPLSCLCVDSPRADLTQFIAEASRPRQQTDGATEPPAGSRRAVLLSADSILKSLEQRLGVKESSESARTILLRLEQSLAADAVRTTSAAADDADDTRLWQKLQLEDSHSQMRQTAPALFASHSQAKAASALARVDAMDAWPELNSLPPSRSRGLRGGALSARAQAEQARRCSPPLHVVIDGRVPPVIGRAADVTSRSPSRSSPRSWRA